MKKVFKICFFVFVFLIVIPVLAKGNVDVKELIGSTNDKNVVIDEKSIDINFNDLNQSVFYRIKLKNNTDDTLYLNNLKTSNISEDFIQVVLDDKSFNKKIAPGKAEDVSFYVKTLDVSGAGRNVDEEVKLNFIFNEKTVKNPSTSNYFIEYVVLCSILFVAVVFILFKFDKKKRLSIFVIGIMLLGTSIVYANDSVTTQITGKIKYSSQNLLKESGINLDTYKVDYTNSVDVWKYAQLVKNIIISDENIKPSDYKEKIDLTIGSTKRVYGYLVENGDDEVLYDLYITANGIIYAPENSTGLLSFPNVESIKGLEFLEFENTQNMSAMFSGDKKLKTANVKSINMQNAKNVSYMFNGCNNLDVKKSDFDVEHVENTLYMFEQKISDVVKENAKSDKGTNYSTEPISGNYLFESSKNDANPIYYFRGAITNNNVKFANFCWKIVRTTETGGTKLVYNGIPNENGSCNNTGAASALDGTSKFAPGYTSPAYVGYMFGTIYDSNSKDLSSQPGKILYGNNFSWDGSKYTLVDTISSSSWKNDRVSLAVKYHYTCFNSDGTCTEIAYVHHFKDEGKVYYLILSDGKGIEDAKEEMFTNETNSEVKIKIDNWYADNMTSYTTYLEDTVWCNDCSIATGSLSGKDFDAGTASSNFDGYVRNFTSLSPSLSCSNKRDSFTVKNVNGNGMLTYPVGLLTADEMTLAGSGSKSKSTTSYLYTGLNQWSMTPHCFNHTNAYEINLYENTADLYSANTSYSKTVRPAISLKQGTKVVYGTGTVSDPYIVE